MRKQLNFNHNLSVLILLLVLIKKDFTYFPFSDGKP